MTTTCLRVYTMERFKETNIEFEIKQVDEAKTFRFEEGNSLIHPI